MWNRRQKFVLTSLHQHFVYVFVFPRLSFTIWVISICLACNFIAQRSKQTAPTPLTSDEIDMKNQLDGLASNQTKGAWPNSVSPSLFFSFFLLPSLCAYKKGERFGGFVNKRKWNRIKIFFFLRFLLYKNFGANVYFTYLYHTKDRTRNFRTLESVWLNFRPVFDAYRAVSQR